MRAGRMVKTGASVLLAILALGWGAAPEAVGQIYGEGERIPGTIEHQATISIDVKERPLADVVAHIQDRVGVNIVLAPGVEGMVTIQLIDIPWREALGVVAERAGCIVIEKSSRLYRIEKPPRVTFSFQNEDIKTVIKAIAKAANADIVVAEDVKGLVNMDLSDVPWRNALETVVRTGNYHVVEDDRGIIRVVSAANLEEQLELQVFELKYLRPRSTYLASIETDYATGETPKPTDDPRKEFKLLEALEKLLSPKGKLEYFDRENVLFVKDTRPVLSKIAEMIERLDVEPVQIYIDVKFVTTANTDASDFTMGLEKGLTATLSGASRQSRLPFNLGAGGITDNLLPGPRDDNFSTARPNNLYSKVTPGVLDFSATSLAVRLLKTDETAEIVQSPKIITLNHQEATIFVGESVRYAEAHAETNQSGGLQLTVREAEGSPVQTGFQLYVRPHVVPGTGKIVMTVIPEAESLTGTTDPNLPGFDLFQVGAGTTGEGSLSLPRVGSQTIVTNMMLESGQTGVIGGLLTDNARNIVTKVPILGDIPIIGWLFKREQKRLDKRGLLVFLTPYIIRGSDRAEEGLAQQIREIEDRVSAEWESFAEQAESLR
ncbi:MAG: hypothetical protein AB1486_00285 [Planctomycetota bacterium]